MFGFIKNLFGGIFAFVGKVLGFNKSEYALDLGGSETTKSEPAKATKSEPAKVEPAKETKPAPTKSEPAKATKSETTKSEPAKVETTKSEPAKAKATQTPPAKPAPKPAAAKAKPEPAKAPAPTGGFAPNYLMPAVTATRRRPGANMSSYLSMARQMKSN